MRGLFTQKSAESSKALIGILAASASAWRAFHEPLAAVPAIGEGAVVAGWATRVSGTGPGLRGARDRTGSGIAVRLSRVRDRGGSGIALGLRGASDGGGLGAAVGLRRARSLGRGSGRHGEYVLVLMI